jgi:SagB-type dehydrogenase family enzyme
VLVVSSKLWWIGAPIAAYVLYAAVGAWRGRLAPRATINAHTSLLLMGYLATTAALGVFWVANQQLPPFDLHYLFGYATLLLLAVHLSLNLPLALRILRAPRRGEPGTATARPSARSVASWIGVAAAVAGAFALGMRHGRGELAVSWGTRAAPGAVDLGPLDVVDRYHAFSSHSRTGVLARAPQVDWGPAPSPTKRTAGERLELPPARGTPVTSGALDRARLAAILWHAAGVTETRGGLLLRASPSSGALFASELYVIAHGVAGLAPGVYHYDAAEHALVRLRDGAVSAGALGVRDGIDTAPATLVLGAIFRRTGHKYHDRAYRYVAADAGHLLENLRIAARETGHDARPLPEIDEAATAQAIGLDEQEEGVMAVVPLLPAGAPDTVAPRGCRAPAFASPATAPASTTLGVTSLVHLGTSLRANVLAEPGVPTDPPEKTAALVRMPPPRAPAEPPLTVIAHRRSARRFDTAAEVPLDALASILHEAMAGTPPLLSRGVRAYVVAGRVTGLAPGVYRYAPAPHALVPTRSGNLIAAAGRAALDQDVIGTAAAVLVLTVDRAVLRTCEGARGYRHALLETGMIGERWLLGAAARALGACPVGAFYDDEAAALLGVSVDDAWVLHFAALGAESE